MREGYLAETVAVNRIASRCNSIYKTKNGRIVQLIHFIRVSKAGRVAHYAIGNDLSGVTTCGNIPIHWKEAGIPFALEIPQQFRGEPSGSRVLSTVSMDQLDVPLFTMSEPRDSLVQYISPSLTVMPKD